MKNEQLQQLSAPPVLQQEFIGARLYTVRMRLDLPSPHIRSR
jgi:hypothetical protein